MLLFFLQAEGGGLISQLPFFAVIFAIIYFFFLRPQAKKQKAQAAFEQELQKGDEVVTTSGIIGKVNKIDAGEINLQLDQKTFIRVLPNSISKELTDAFQKRNDEKK